MSSCNVKPQYSKMDNYRGYIVVQKPIRHYVKGNYAEYTIRVRNDNEVAEIVVTELDFNYYSIGDTIK